MVQKPLTDKEQFWDLLSKPVRDCHTCYWKDKQNVSPIRSEFEVRCMGCIMYDDLPYWEWIGDAEAIEKKKEDG